MLVKAKDVPAPIEPSETISFVVNLAKEYLIDNAGSYTIRINDNYCNSQHYQTANDTFIEVFNEELQPVTTWYQTSSASQKLHSSAIKSFGSHKAYYATDVQFKELKEAHYKAYEILENIQASNGTFLRKFVTPYKEMFCSNDTSAWPFVYSNMTHMKSYMDVGMKYHFNSADCGPRVYAYVYPADKEKSIYLCEQYDKSSSFPSEEHPYDTKAGTIIHEVSHKAVNSMDHFYSYDECKITASSCIVSNTTTNADCLQIFSELCFLSGVNPGEDDEL